MTNNLIIALAIIVIFGVAGAAAVNFAYEENQEDVNIVNESVNVSTLDSPITLEESSVTDATYDDAEDITVRNATSGEEIASASNYTWHENNGTITFLSGGEFSLGGDAEIDYGYIVPDELQKGLIGMIGAIYDWWPFLVFVLGVIILLRAAGEL